MPFDRKLIVRSRRLDKYIPSLFFSIFFAIVRKDEGTFSSLNLSPYSQGAIVCDDTSGLPVMRIASIVVLNLLFLLPFSL